MGTPLEEKRTNAEGDAEFTEKIRENPHPENRRVRHPALERSKSTGRNHPAKGAGWGGGACATGEKPEELEFSSGADCPGARGQFNCALGARRECRP
jgi:hypothetical protein